MSRASTSAYNLGTISSPLSLYYQEYKENRLSEEGTHQKQKGVVSVITLSGRPLPSKWDDAERWICSPVSGNPGEQTTLLQKSKSGPILQLSNPPHNFVVSDSPFSTGVLVPPPGVSLYYNNNNNNNNNSRGRVSKSSRWTDLATDSSSLEEEEEEQADCRETITSLTKDMATQMSPDRRNCSSPPTSDSPAKLDIREVQVDNRATLISLADQNASFSSNQGYLDREEAKIAAWENLHKAKAEAAIRKLEMELEKKRASSMDAISNKLRAAEMKAENMRKSTSITSKQNQTSKTYYHKVKFFLSGCVTC